MSHYADSGHHAPDVHSLEDALTMERAYPNSSLDGDRIAKRARALLGSTGLALDVGCGYGFLARAAKRVGFDVTTIELAATERRIATEMLGCEPVASPFEDYAATPGSFDVVFMSQILEHALDVNAWVDKAHALLRPGGLFAIALPNFGSAFRHVMQEREPYICPPDHLNFFDGTSLKQLVERHAFEVREVSHVSRLPRSTFARRLGDGALTSAACWLAPRVLSALDGARLGQILNLYAQKR
jgi:SAM-dependent methyltransferase